MLGRTAGPYAPESGSGRCRSRAAGPRRAGVPAAGADAPGTVPAGAPTAAGSPGARAAWRRSWSARSACPRPLASAESIHRSLRPPRFWVDTWTESVSEQQILWRQGTVASLVRGGCGPAFLKAPIDTASTGVQRVRGRDPLAAVPVAAAASDAGGG